jgi:ubiquinone biosynthesis protein
MFNIRHPTRNIRRLVEVQATFVRYGFDFLFEATELRRIRALMGKRFRKAGMETLQLSIPERLRLIIQELGPTYIKLGQILSSRSDLLPDEFIRELSRLQDRVPPVPFEQVEQVIQQEFKKSIPEIFLDFEPQPFAAASIGQVHYACLFDATPVVVKVQRPDIRAQVESDIEIIRSLVRLIESANGWIRRYGLSEIFDEFARTLERELDYRNEASNADHLRRLMMPQHRVRVPIVYWELTTERILTMERCDGIKINDLKALDAAHVDRIELARVFINSLLTQLLLEGFYHADPHPGNLLVDPDDETLIYIDLGMTGRLLADQRQALEDIILSIMRRDSADVTRIIMNIGTPFQKVNERSLLYSVDYIINRYLEVSLEQIQFATLLKEILGTIFRHNIRLPSEYSLAVKAIMQGEEIARQLDPQISIAEIAESVSRRIILQRLAPENVLDVLRDTTREFYRLRTVMPRAMESIVRQLAEGKLVIGLDIPMFNWIVNSILVIANRLVAGLIITGMLIAAAILMNIFSGRLGTFFQVLGAIGFVVAFLLGGTMVWSVIAEIRRQERSKKDEL